MLSESYNVIPEMSYKENLVTTIEISRDLRSSLDIHYAQIDQYSFKNITLPIKSDQVSRFPRLHRLLRFLILLQRWAFVLFSLTSLALLRYIFRCLLFTFVLWQSTDKGVAELAHLSLPMSWGEVKCVRKPKLALPFNLLPLMSYIFFRHLCH